MSSHQLRGLHCASLPTLIGLACTVACFPAFASNTVSGHSNNQAQTNPDRSHDLKSPAPTKPNGVVHQTGIRRRGNSVSPRDRTSSTKPITLKEVVVTGSIVPRSATHSLAPIDIITSQEIADTGASNIGAAIRALIPSFNMPQAAVRGSATANIRPAQLRGLSPDETLVLVNGKPYHTTSYINTSGFSEGSSPTDLNSIPMAAVQSIEVLRDGASTLYGSGAIAGVINIILKGGGQGGSADVTQGFWYPHQGITTKADVSQGFRIGEKGWVRVSANYLRRTPTNEAGPDDRFPADPTFGTVTGHFGLPYTLSKQFAINAQYNINNDTTLYAYSLLSKRQGHENGVFNSLSQYKTQSPGAVTIFPEGYLPLVFNKMLDSNTTLGIRGVLGGWNYNVSLTTGSSHVKANVFDDVNLSLGALSPTSFYTGTTIFREDDFNASVRRQFDVGLAGPLTLELGVADQYQKYVAKEGDRASYIGEGVGGIAPADAGLTSRNDRAVFAASTAKVTNRLTVSASGRYEYYSDFGNNFSWSTQARYAFTPWLALRGSYTTGFRAPSVQQEGYTNIGQTFVHIGNTLVPFQIGTFKPTSPVARAIGATPLRPETSKGATIGVVVTPTHGPTVTLDAYDIKVRDTIQWTGNLVGPNVSTFLAGQGFPDVTGIRFFSNLTNNEVLGEDLVATWPLRLRNSSLLKLSLAVSHYRQRITSVNPFPPVWQTIGVNPVLSRDTLIPIPVTKIVATGTWTKGPWSLNGRLTKYSSETIYGTTPATDETFAARWLTDLSASYAFNNGVRVTLGSNNVFNVFPAHALLNTYNLDGNIPYLNDSPFGYFGRYVYVRIGFRWGE